MRSEPKDPNAELKELLTFLHPNLDVDAIFSEMLHVPSIGLRICDQPLSELKKHFPNSTAQLIHLLPGTARHVLRSAYPEHPRIVSPLSLGPYLRGYYLGLEYEHCHITAMRKTGHVISTQLVQRGTTRQLPFYVGNILRMTLESDAAAIVISHNHPGGTIAPSDADINCTLQLIQALAPLEIPLVDHIIMTDTRALSIRESFTDQIPESIWQMQPNHCPGLLKKWLTPPKT